MTHACLSSLVCSDGVQCLLLLRRLVSGSTLAREMFVSSRGGDLQDLGDPLHDPPRVFIGEPTMDLYSDEELVFVEAMRTKRPSLWMSRALHSSCSRVFFFVVVGDIAAVDELIRCQSDMLVKQLEHRAGVAAEVCVVQASRVAWHWACCDGVWVSCQIASGRQQAAAMINKFVA